MNIRQPHRTHFATIAITLLLVTATAYATQAQSHDSPPRPAVDTNIHTLKEAGLQFEVPKAWKVEQQDNGNVVVSLEDGAVSVTFVVEDNYTDAIAGMKSGLKENLTEMKSEGEAKQDTHNGMTHIEESGSGLLKDAKVTWSIDVLKATKNVTILTFGVDSILKAHADEYVKFVNSIKKI